MTSDGGIFFTAFQDNVRVEVLRSDNKGKSWNVVSPQFSDGQNAQLLSFDPYLYVDDVTDRVFTIDLTVACSYLSFSDDRGESWTTNPLACGRPINDHQTLFAGPPVSSRPTAYENIVYYCWNDILTSSCSKSIDGGITFSVTGQPAFFPGDGTEGQGSVPRNCGGLHGHGIVGGKGVVYLPKGHCEEPWLAISSNEGATWTRVRVSSKRASTSDPTVDVDSRGNVYYGWVSDKGLPFLTISRDGGKSWSRPAMIAAPGVAEANLLTLDVGKPGSLAFAYMGTEDPRFPKKWNGYLGMTTSALGRRPLFFTATVNDKRDPLKRGACGPGRCGEQILDFLDIVIGTDGTPWAAFVDACDSRCARSGFERGNEGIVGHLVSGPELR